MGDRFFEEKQAGAVLKHGILGRYLHVFASKTGHTSPGGRVGFLDGYAGPGLYTDGSEGSPALALGTASKLASFRTLEGVYIEKERESFEKLKVLLAETSHKHRVFHGGVEEHLTEALEVLGPDIPLFAYFDPFGLPLSMERIKEVFARGMMSGGRRSGPATEVLVTFMYPAIRRVAGQLTGTGTAPSYLRAKDTMVARMDATLGGDWWHEMWRESEDLDSDERCGRIGTEYLKQIAGSIDCEWGWYRVPVRQRWAGPILYELFFVTLYPREGLWEFNNSVSLGFDDYLKYCQRGELDLDESKALDERYVREVKANIEELLSEEGTFIVFDKMQRVLKTSVGAPRDKHVRKAIKQLYREGKTCTTGKGKIRDMTVSKPEEDPTGDEP